MSRFKTGVTYLNVNYNVNERKRVVTCYLKWGINLDRLPFIEMLSESDKFRNDLLSQGKIETWVNDDTGETNSFITFETVDFADCSDEDIFNEQLGKHISLTRAQKNAFNGAKQFYDYCSYIMANAIERFSQLFENCDKSYISCKEHVNKLIK